MSDLERKIDYAPARESTWRTAEVVATARYRLLGVPLIVETNAPALLALADDVFPLRDAELEAPDAKRLRIFVHDPPTGVDFPSPITRIQTSPARTQGAGQHSYLMLNCGASFGFADRAAGFASAFVTPSLAADKLRIQSYFLETLALYIVCAERPVTLHAAAFVHNGKCVLVTGEQGAGKSTLSYAWVRSSGAMLAEDIVFGADPLPDNLTMFSNPAYLHLLPDSVRFFPELETAQPVKMLNGESKLRIRVNSIHSGAAVHTHGIDAVVSLGRSSLPHSRIAAADVDHVRRALTRFEGSPPIDESAMADAADRLLQLPLAHLESGADPVEAADTLRRWMEAI